MTSTSSALTRLAQSLARTAGMNADQFQCSELSDGRVEIRRGGHCARYALSAWVSAFARDLYGGRFA